MHPQRAETAAPIGTIRAVSGTGSTKRGRSRPDAAAPDLATLVGGAESAGSDPGPPRRTIAEHWALRTGTGTFLVPARGRRVTVRSLLAYNRLRPPRVRAGRALAAGAICMGAGSLLATRRRLVAVDDAPTLLDVLASALDEPHLVFAATEQPGNGFLTPVLQLFTTRGASVGFAKVGWDEVTRDMIDTEAATLRKVADAHWSTVHVPEVAWHGRTHDLAVLITAPMPTRARRLRGAELPPIEPLHEVGRLDGPLRRHRLDASPYWHAVTAAVDAAGQAGLRDDDLVADLEHVAHDHADVELDFGRWHGDWVEWNLARAGRQLYAWDWAYSAPDVPFGFDLLQFFHLRFHNREDLPEPVALDRAATAATPALARLGVDSATRAGVVALHRVEVRLRRLRAACLRRAVGTGGVATP